MGFNSGFKGLTSCTWPCKSYIFTVAKACFNLNAFCCTLFSLPGKKHVNLMGLFCCVYLLKKVLHCSYLFLFLIYSDYIFGAVHVVCNV